MAKGKYHEWQTKKGLKQLKKWAEDGLIDAQIAHNVGITTKTLYEWKNKYSSICDALKEGKRVIDLEVENALLKRARGYQEEIESVKVLSDGSIIRFKEILLHEPSTTAQIFWLKNRQPEKWRDRKVVEITGTIDSFFDDDDDDEI